MACFLSATAALAAPAFANSGNAQVAAPLLGVQAAALTAPTSGDAEFNRLFASWRSLDRGDAAPGALAILAPARTGSAPSLMPVSNPRLTSSFGMRWHPVYGGHRMHTGVDLAEPMGTPIHASGDGTVGRADYYGSYGLCVDIDHTTRMETRYGHMSRVNVVAGQFVHRGDVIGYVGATGDATGPHLHYEVRIDGQPVNPMPYMQGGTQLAAQSHSSTQSIAPENLLAAAD